MPDPAFVFSFVYLQKFCAVCWSQHLDDMRIQIESILKQLDSAASRLEHKIDHYKVPTLEPLIRYGKYVVEEKC